IFILSSPNNHFIAYPHRRMEPPSKWGVGSASGCPSVCARIISPPCIEKGGIVLTAPNSHFTAGPHCFVSKSSTGRIGKVGSYPSVGAGIVPSATVKVDVRAVRIYASPDDHFTAGPHRRVRGSAVGRIGDAGGRPHVVDAVTRRTGYHRK